MRVTIADVANRAGVSAQTVSRVINNKGEISAETRERVLTVIQELGYRPNRIARSLATQQTYTIGLVIPDIANPFFSELTRGAEDAAWEMGYNVLLCNTVETDQREKSSLHLLEETRVDGVIVCSSRQDDDQLFPVLRSFPAAVLVNRIAPAEVAGVVRTDDHLGGRMAVQHLLAGGRRKIAFLAGPHRSHSGVERLRGGMEVLHENGMEICENWQIFGAPKRKAGYEAVINLLQLHPEINAIICHNDLMAVGALQACTELGLSVPGDIALVGFDDTVYSRVVCPPLTTIGVSKVELGMAAARMLFERIQGTCHRNEVVFEPKLIIRGSTPAIITQ